jgi:hypothetical protein
VVRLDRSRLQSSVQPRTNMPAWTDETFQFRNVRAMAALTVEVLNRGAHETESSSGGAGDAMIGQVSLSVSAMDGESHWYKLEAAEAAAGGLRVAREGMIKKAPQCQGEIHLRCTFQLGMR